MIPVPQAIKDVAESGSSYPVVLIEIDNNTDWFFTNRPLDEDHGSGWDDYKPYLLGMDESEESLNEGLYGLAMVNDWVFRLANTEPKLNKRIASTLTNGTLENKEVVVKFGYYIDEEGYAFPLSSFVRIFTGIVRDYKFNEEHLEITLYDATFKRHKFLPQTAIDSDDAHEKVRGKFLPICYGTINKAKGYLIDTTLGAQKVRFDSNVVAQLGDLFVFDDNYGTFVQVNDSNETMDSAYPEYIKDIIMAWFSFTNTQGDGNPFAEAGAMMLKHDVKIMDASFVSGDVSNPNNLVDENVTTYSLLNIEAPSSPPNAEFKNRFLPIVGLGLIETQAYAHIVFPIDINMELGEPIHLYFIGKVTFNDYVPTTVTNDILIEAWLQVNNEEPNIFVGGGKEHRTKEIHLFDYEVPETNANFNNYNGSDPINAIDLIDQIAEIYTGDDDSESNYVPIVRWTGRNGYTILKNGRFIIGGYWGKCSPGNHDFEVKAYLAKLRVVSRLMFSETPLFYSDIYGRLFGPNWLDKNPYGTVRQAGDVINALFRHELDLTSDEIDEDSFGAVNTRLNAIVQGGDFNLAGQVFAKIRSDFLIENICKQISAKQFKRYNGKEALAILDTSKPIQHHFDIDNIIRETFSCDRENQSHIYNEFYIHFNKNYANDEFESVVFVTADEHNFEYTPYGDQVKTLCGQSQTKYGTVNRYTLEADFIRDRNVAEALVYELAVRQQVTLRHYKATFYTFFGDAIELEPCDMVSLDHPWVPDSVNGSSNKWEVFCKRMDPLKGVTELIIRSAFGD